MSCSPILRCQQTVNNKLSTNCQQTQHAVISTELLDNVFSAQSQTLDEKVVISATHKLQLKHEK